MDVTKSLNHWVCVEPSAIQYGECSISCIELLYNNNNNNNKWIYIRFIYLIPWNLDCDPWVSWSFFYKTTIIDCCFVKNNHRLLFCKKLHETQGSQSKFYGIRYINQLEHTYSSYVRIRDVALKTSRRQWTIGRSGERGSGISMLAARHDDDDDDDDTHTHTYIYIYIYIYVCVCVCVCVCITYKWS